MKKEVKNRKQYMKEISKKRAKLIAKKERKERRNKRLIKLGLIIFGLGIAYLGLGILGIVTVGIYSFVKYFIIGSEKIFE